MPSSTSCTEYATSSAQSITCASRQRRSPGAPAPQPGEDRRVVGVHPELALPRPARPRVLARSRRATARVRLSPADAPSGASTLASSRVSTRSVCALPSKPPHGVASLVQRVLAVVPERRVPEVVGEPGGVHHVRVAAQPGAHLPGDLGHLQRVGQPGTQEVVGAGGVHLGLRGQPAERRRVQHPGPVALVRRPAVPGVLGRLLDQPGVRRPRLTSHAAGVVRDCGLATGSLLALTRRRTRCPPGRPAPSTRTSP